MRRLSLTSPAEITSQSELTVCTISLNETLKQTLLQFVAVSFGLLIGVLLCFTNLYVR
jgi:hypothetical protein